jgi:hypothetical protein
MLCIGQARIGKTYLISTCPMPIYVIYADYDEGKLESATKAGAEFTYDLLDSTDAVKLVGQAQDAIDHAKKVKPETVVFDTLSTFSHNLINACIERTESHEGKERPQAGYDLYTRKMTNIVGQLINLKSHVIVMSHDRLTEESKKTTDTQVKKTGNGILPNIYGSVREMLPGMFRDVCYIERKVGSQERILVTGANGAYRAGCATVPGYETHTADIKKFIETGKSLKTLE